MALDPTGPGLTLDLVSIILLVLSWVVVTARVIVRRSMKALGVDDWMMLSGLVSNLEPQEAASLYLTI